MNGPAIDYLALQNSFVPVPLDCIPTGTKLPFPLYVLVGQKPTLFRNIGEVLNPDRVLELTKKIDTVLLPKAYWSDLYRYFREVDITGTIEELELARILTLIELTDLHEKMELTSDAVTRLQELSLRWCTAATYGSVVTPPAMIRRYHDPGVYFASHSFNTAIYTALAVKELSTPADAPHAFFSALLQNCGEIEIPKEIIMKAGPLDLHDWHEVKKHPALGSEMLRRLGLPDEIVRVSAEHHERADGSGYPNGLTGDAICALARLGAIADAFDALQSTRAHSGPRSHEETALTLLKLKVRYDSEFLSLILKMKV